MVNGTGQVLAVGREEHMQDKGSLSSSSPRTSFPLSLTHSSGILCYHWLYAPFLPTYP